MSRTRPTKQATPPIAVLPRVSAAISAPTSNGSRWTRITGSPSGYRREQCDLVAGPDRMVGADILLVDRASHDGPVGECRGMARAAGGQPIDELSGRGDVPRRINILLTEPDPGAQPREIEHLHVAIPTGARSQR